MIEARGVCEITEAVSKCLLKSFLMTSLRSFPLEEQKYLSNPSPGASEDQLCHSAEQAPEGGLYPRVHSPAPPREGFRSRDTLGPLSSSLSGSRVPSKASVVSVQVPWDQALPVSLWVCANNAVPFLAAALLPKQTFRCSRMKSKMADICPQETEMWTDSYDRSPGCWSVSCLWFTHQWHLVPSSHHLKKKDLSLPTR